MDTLCTKKKVYIYIFVYLEICTFNNYKSRKYSKKSFTLLLNTHFLPSRTWKLSIWYIDWKNCLLLVSFTSWDFNYFFFFRQIIFLKEGSVSLYHLFYTFSEIVRNQKKIFSNICDKCSTININDKLINYDEMINYW